MFTPSSNIVPNFGFPNFIPIHFDEPFILSMIYDITEFVVLFYQR
jgi:hypothetical protein